MDDALKILHGFDNSPKTARVNREIRVGLHVSSVRRFTKKLPQIYRSAGVLY